jgi:hypothetical protein
MLISLFVVLLTVSTFSRLTGTENIRAIHIATLLVCGMGIGVFMCSTLAYFRKTE